MFRRILAVVAGIAVAVLLVTLIQKVGHGLYPPPADLDPADQEFMAEYVAGLPWGPLAFVLASYVLATIGGGWIAGAIAGERPLVYAGIVAVFILAGAIFTVMTIPHPSWFTWAAVIGIVAGALVAAMLGSRGGSFRKSV
jgi:hypothetical protein